MKKGSLSLSVNAIVIFVLAFAMLGFGIFIIQKLQGQTDPAISTAFDLGDLSAPPTSQNPVVISEKIQMKSTETKRFGIGIYNTKDTALTTVAPEFLQCTGLDVPGTDAKIKIETLPVSIDASTSYAYTTNIVSVGATKGNYICEIGIKDEGISKQFEVEIN